MRRLFPAGVAIATLVTASAALGGVLNGTYTGTTSQHYPVSVTVNTSAASFEEVQGRTTLRYSCTSSPSFTSPRNQEYFRAALNPNGSFSGEVGGGPHYYVIKVNGSISGSRLSGVVSASEYRDLSQSDKCATGDVTFTAELGNAVAATTTAVAAVARNVFEAVANNQTRLKLQVDSAGNGSAIRSISTCLPAGLTFRPEKQAVRAVIRSGARSVQATVTVEPRCEQVTLKKLGIARAARDHAHLPR